MQKGKAQLSTLFTLTQYGKKARKNILKYSIFKISGKCMYFQPKNTHTQKSFKPQDASSQYFKISLSFQSQATKIVLFYGYTSPFPKRKMQLFLLHQLLFQIAT